MLTLIQTINYMMVYLEYTEAEVRKHFEHILSDTYTFETLLDAIGLEINSTALQLAKDKMTKWESALFVVKMRSED